MSPEKRLAEDAPSESPCTPVASVDQSRVAGTDPLPALRTMARGLVHDLNNVLSPVLGYTELLLEDSQLTVKQRQCLERLEAGGQRAVEILRRLDLFYREAHQHALVDVPVAALVREVITEKPFASLGFQLELDDSLSILADPAELRILLLQLFANAVDASPEGTSEIVVRWSRQAAGASLEVRDCGAGMPPLLCQVCHEPFQTTKSDVGAGLGLSMCLGIVRRLAGTMEIHSTVGEGTSVRIVLPGPRVA